MKTQTFIVILEHKDEAQRYSKGVFRDFFRFSCKKLATVEKQFAEHLKYIISQNEYSSSQWLTAGYYQQGIEVKIHETDFKDTDDNLVVKYNLLDKIQQLTK